MKITPHRVAMALRSPILLLAVMLTACGDGGSSSPSNPTRTAIASFFARPSNVAVDSSGNVFVADTGNNEVKQLRYNKGAYGAPVIPGSGFNFPHGVAVDSSGNIYVMDAGHIRLLTP